jgi:hypothetical protein
MNIDQTEETFQGLIKVLNFIRHLGVDIQFDHDCPDYCGMINTIPSEHGMDKYDMECFHENEPAIELILKSMGLEIGQAGGHEDEFILEEIRK